MFISESGMIVRVGASSISRIGRNTPGVRLVNLKADDRLIASARVIETNGNGDGDAPAADDDPASLSAAPTGETG